MPVTFIHCADLHLGSPFKGITAVAPELGRKLYRATFKAFENIIDLALERRVDFVVAAGDVFDSEYQSLKSVLFLREQLRRLDDAGIRFFIACGNHDPLSNNRLSVKLPENTIIFSSQGVERHIITRAGQEIAAVYGCSYPVSAVTENLAAKFRACDDNMPSIAVLHANIGGNRDHEPYAPAEIMDLTDCGIDYWALGHVHSYAILRDNAPAVVYSGCPQGRSPREHAAKGCCLVSITDKQECQVKFVPTDEIRFATRIIPVAEEESLDTLLNKMLDITATADRDEVLRLTLTGITALNRELHSGDVLNELLEQTREELQRRHPAVYLERITLETSNPRDLDELAVEGGFMADVITLSNQLLTASADRKKLCEELAAISACKRDLDAFSDDELLEIVKSAQLLLVDELSGGPEA